MHWVESSRQFGVMGRLVGPNIWRARWSSVTIVLCVALVVVVLMSLLSMARGFESVAQNAGAADVAVFVGRQSQSESYSRIEREQVELLRSAPGLQQTGDEALLSPEFAMTVGGGGSGDGAASNMTLRGMTDSGVALRRGFRLTEGRLYQSGRQEIIAGRRLKSQAGGIEVGQVLNLAGRDWTVVGVFDLDNAIFASELWADLGSVQSAYGRQNEFQSVRVRMTDPSRLPDLQDFVAQDPRLTLDVLSEQDLYREQVESTTNLILYIAWPLTFILSTGCIAGVFNTLLISLRGRMAGFRILGLLGFSRAAIVTGVVMEVLLLSLVGCAAGAALVYLTLNGADHSTLGAGFVTVNYNLRVDPASFFQALWVAVGIGSLGAVAPAWAIVRKSLAH